MSTGDLSILAAATEIFVNELATQNLGVGRGAIEQPNCYTIWDSRQQLFTARELAEHVGSSGPDRPFDIAVQDKAGRDVLRFDRLDRNRSCLFPCCLQHMDVYLHPNQLIGSIRQRWSCCSEKFDFRDETGRAKFKMTTPFYYLSPVDVDFPVTSASDKKDVVAVITKQWGGYEVEKFTKADNYHVTFQASLTAHDKAMVIGATILIDFLHYGELMLPYEDRPTMLEKGKMNHWERRRVERDLHDKRRQHADKEKLAVAKHNSKLPIKSKTKSP